MRRETNEEGAIRNLSGPTAEQARKSVRFPAQERGAVLVCEMRGEDVVPCRGVADAKLLRYVYAVHLYDAPFLRFLIFDRDAQYGLEVPVAVRSLKMSPVRTSFEGPWQNGVAERWVESCRRDLLDHIIAVNERHLKRLLSHYVRYYHEDRTHLGLGKGMPNCRTRSGTSGRVLSQERLGGLHHRYDRAA